MVTKTKLIAAKPATRRAAPRKTASKPLPDANAIAIAAATTKPTAKPNLLRAGLKALGSVRDDVVQHRSRVFEAILGIDPKQPWPAIGRAAAGKAAQEAFGLRKFEAVFDQRVAHALERMGMPSAQALQALVQQVAEMNETLRRIEAAQRKR